jgi:hypothetical protein
MYSLKQHFYSDQEISQSISLLESEIRKKQIPAITAARQLLDKYYKP